MLALSRLPQFLIPSAMVVLMVVGLLSPLAIAVIALTALVAFMAWLAFLSWPVLAPPQRAMRALAIALLTGAGVARVAGWF